MLSFFEPSLIQKKVLQGLQAVGGAFNENKASQLQNLDMFKQKGKRKEKTRVKSPADYIFDKICELHKLVCVFSIFHSKVSKLRKISYDVTI